MATSRIHRCFFRSVPSICHSYIGIRGSFSFVIIVASLVISPVNCDPDLTPLVFILPLSNEGSLSGLNFPAEF